MTPHAALISELYLVLANAETDAALYRAAQGRGAVIQHGTLEDHRTNVLGDEPAFAFLKDLGKGCSPRAWG